MPHRWSNAATIRREQIESGVDITFNEIFKPLIIDRINELSPTYILECGAGTGHISKELSSLKYNVTAIEPSLGMYDVALDVLAKSSVKLLNCKCCELSNSKHYDVVFSHLVVQTVENILDHFLSIATHLKHEGHYLFSIPHPCFYNAYKKIFDKSYKYSDNQSHEISFKITKDKNNTITNVPYHHRPISTYINTLAKAGFYIEHFEEIYPKQSIQKLYGEPWASPRYILFTCRTHDV